MSCDSRRPHPWLLLLAVAALGFQPGAAQSPIRRVVLDEAHHNYLATASGPYRTFVALARSEGFFVTSSRRPVTAEGLAITDVLVIANPMGSEPPAPLDQQAKAAFTLAETDAIHAWVEKGGGLLLATDHYPSTVAVRTLTHRFGVETGGGWTDDPQHRRRLPNYGEVFGHLVFSRENGLLGDHPLTRGRSDVERVDAVVSTTGTSLAGPEGSVAILRLGSRAVDLLPPAAAPASADHTPDFNPCVGCQVVSAAGRNQGLALEAGRGRVIVLGEMGILIDHSVPGTSNRQFAVNALRWLTREYLILPRGFAPRTPPHALSRAASTARSISAWLARALARGAGQLVLEMGSRLLFLALGPDRLRVGQNPLRIRLEPLVPVGHPVRLDEGLDRRSLLQGLLRRGEEVAVEVDVGDEVGPRHRRRGMAADDGVDVLDGRRPRAAASD